MHNLKNNTNGLTYDRNWVSENMLVVAKGKEVERGMDWELGISRCKLSNIEGINRVLSKA